MLSFLYSLTAGGILILSFLILTNPRKVNVLGNRWLGFFLFGLFFMLVDEPLFSFKIYEHHPNLLGYESFFIFALAPALYLSVSHYISLEKTFKKLEYLHFLPTLILFPFVLYTIFMSSKEKLEIIRNPILPGNFEFDWITYVLILQILIYIYFAFYKIHKHQKNIRLFTSNTSEISLNWLKNALIGILLMVFLWIIEIQFYENILITKISGIGYFIGVYVIAYYAFRQEEIYPFKEKEKQEIKEIIEETPSSKSQRISEDELKILKSKLILIMSTEKHYLDETLSLPKLAEKVKISIHNLSFVLNEGFNENFFQFVNRYRIEEAKRLLLSEKYQQLSMIGIAFESGFSSKTTFNTTFKKLTGISPSEYITQFSTEKTIA
jgi:AraC-like DNA-binding protein